VKHENETEYEGARNKSGNKNPEEKSKGPMSQRFNPNNGTEGKFKGGKPGNMTVCKRRYQQISITALGDVP
jgi:hypothetical protein